MRRVLDDYPHLALVATTLREAHTATGTTGAPCAHDRDAFHVGPPMQRLEIFDRVGGGDSFASGLIYGLLDGRDVDTALAYGVAHGALAMTTPGDTSMATLPRSNASWPAARHESFAEGRVAGAHVDHRDARAH